MNKTDFGTSTKTGIRVTLVCNLQNDNLKSTGLSEKRSSREHPFQGRVASVEHSKLCRAFGWNIFILSVNSTCAHLLSSTFHSRIRANSHVFEEKTKQQNSFSSLVILLLSVINLELYLTRDFFFLSERWAQFRMYELVFPKLEFKLMK